MKLLALTFLTTAFIFTGAKSQASDTVCGKILKMVESQDLNGELFEIGFRPPQSDSYHTYKISRLDLDTGVSVLIKSENEVHFVAMAGGLNLCFGDFGTAQGAKDKKKYSVVKITSASK